MPERPFPSPAGAPNDIVEVRGDYHPAEDPKVVAWKDSHSVTRVGTRNQAPFLTEPAVSPTGGDDQTSFVFSVQYADLEGDLPQVSIILDGERVPMEFSRGLVTMDAAFRFAAQLGPGIHTYQFVADDRAGAPMSAEGILVILIVGLIAGWLAGQIVRGTGYGLVADICIGIIGAFIGAWLLPKLGIHLGRGIVAAIISATIGAVVLLLILWLINRRGGSRWRWR